MASVSENKREKSEIFNNSTKNEKTMKSKFSIFVKSSGNVSNKSVAEKSRWIKYVEIEEKVGKIQNMFLTFLKSSENVGKKLVAEKNRWIKYVEIE